MNIKTLLSSCCTAAAVLALAASAGWAAPTVCTVKSVGTGANTAKIAVASNFYEPAQVLVDLFQATAGGANTAITICHNSTAHLLAEINNGTDLPPSVFPSDPGFPRYNMFFAANETSPVSLETPTGNTAFRYANGIPVFFGLRGTVGTVGNLITGLGSDYDYTIEDACTDAGLEQYTINTASAQKVALAASGAPYGVKSYQIINAITSDEGSPTNLPTTIPSWVYSTLFDNIDVTYNNVITPGATGIKSGFVGKSQICDQLGSVTYVAFTGTECLLPQGAILLKTQGGSNNSTAVALNTYIQGLISGGGWNSWFLPGQCYAGI